MATIIDQETDARFWASTHYRPGQKLDPKDPSDAKMIPVWLDIQSKVKREFDAGTLVTTFDHPAVAPKIADAHVADQAATAHLEAAKTAPDQTTAQQHVDAAATAVDVSKQKLDEAAAHQPPTASPQLTHEASQAAAASPPPPPSAPAKDHLAHAQAVAAHQPSPQDILMKETDARFWAGTGYKPGQKLDPSNPTDAKMIPVWLDVYRKVKAEDRAGKLVITYNHPVVSQNIADAHVADQVTGMHVDAAAAAPDAATRQQHVEAATTAAQVSDQKMRENGRLQPPTVSPAVAHQAAARVDERAVRETYERFWATTHYRPGHRLDQRDPQDARMVPTWMGIYQQVLHAHEVGHGPATGREQIAREQARGAGRRADENNQHHRRHGRRPKSTVSKDNLQRYRAQAADVARGAGAQFVLVIQHPDGSLDHQEFTTRVDLDAAYAKIADAHDQFAYVAEFDLQAAPGAPVRDVVGVAAVEHAEVPPEVTAPEPEPAPSGAPPTTEITPSPEPSKWSTGKIAAIAAAGLAVVGGIVYVSSRGKKRGSGAHRSRTPKVIVATPTRATSVT